MKWNSNAVLYVSLDKTVFIIYDSQTIFEPQITQIWHEK